jgi:hypothetical protein
MALFTACADARVELHHGRYDQAAAALAGLGIAERPWYDNTPHWDYDAYAWALAAEAAVLAGAPRGHPTSCRRRASHPENLWAAACLARATGRLHDNRAALEKSLDGWQRIGSRFEHACTAADHRPGSASTRRAERARLPPPTAANLPLRQRQVPAPTQEGLPYSCRHGASWKRMPRV